MNKAKEVGYVSVKEVGLSLSDIHKGASLKVEGDLYEGRSFEVLGRDFDDTLNEALIVVDDSGSEFRLNERMMGRILIDTEHAAMSEANHEVWDHFDPVRLMDEIEYQSGGERVAPSIATWEVVRSDAKDFYADGAVNYGALTEHLIESGLYSEGGEPLFYESDDELREVFASEVLGNDIFKASNHEEGVGQEYNSVLIVAFSKERLMSDLLGNTESNAFLEGDEPLEEVAEDLLLEVHLRATRMLSSGGETLDAADERIKRGMHMVVMNEYMEGMPHRVYSPFTGKPQATDMGELCKGKAHYTCDVPPIVSSDRQEVAEQAAQMMESAGSEALSVAAIGEDLDVMLVADLKKAVESGNPTDISVITENREASFATPAA